MTTKTTEKETTMTTENKETTMTTTKPSFADRTAARIAARIEL